MPRAASQLAFYGLQHFAMLAQTLLTVTGMHDLFIFYFELLSVPGDLLFVVRELASFAG